MRAVREGSPTIATIDDLLNTVDSKYSLVHLAARRAREVNNYYHSLGEGLGQYTPPLVDQVDSNKPLSIALEEIAQEKIVVQMVGDARRAAEELLGSELEEGGAEAQILSLEADAETAADETDEEEADVVDEAAEETPDEPRDEA